MEIKKIAQSTGNELSWTEFVAQSLNLPEEEVKAMVKYHKLVEKVNISKTKDVLDFLLSEGFLPKQVSFSLLFFLMLALIVPGRCFTFA